MEQKAEVLKLYKKEGQTPLECLMDFKKKHPIYEGVKMTYLGRLDPMAEGLLLVLAGDTKKKDDFLLLDKAYEFEILWGIETDTYDILGVVQSVNIPQLKGFEKGLMDAINKCRKKVTQDYPPYSSRTYGGKPLWEWARENKIHEVEKIEKGIKIFSLEHINTKFISADELLNEVEKRLKKVKGDFRQKQILGSWVSSLEKGRGESFLFSSLRADVSSGTYIRSLANDMGKHLRTGALAYRIKRTRVGNYLLD